jgi:transcriptional regulator with XRE-family HTH domain
MTDFQREREALGAWLHRLRRDSGLNGKELALRLGWAPSKVSRIENGRQTPTEPDISAWAGAVGRPDAAEELIARLHALDSHYVSWRRSLQAGHAPRQRVGAELDSQTRELRIFEPGMIPGLLQTAEYARTLFDGLVDLNGSPSDIAEAVRARMDRQRVLYEPDRQFHILVTTAALRTRVCRSEAHRGQLDRLLAVSSLSNVRLGVVPDQAGWPLAPLHPFWIYDARLVQAEIWTAELNLTEPREIALYQRVFESYAAIAVYGAEARRIVNRVVEELVREEEAERSRAASGMAGDTASASAPASAPAEPVQGPSESSPPVQAARRVPPQLPPQPDRGEDAWREVPEGGGAGGGAAVEAGAADETSEGAAAAESDDPEAHERTGLRSNGSPLEQT